MAGKIPSEFIDRVLERVDVVDVIDSRVQLKKAGKDYQARCPFHSEKTPSFTVSQQKQFYHCFGCGAHGSAIGFLMEYEHMSFPEAVEELARQAGLEVPHTAAPSSAPDPQPAFGVLAQADGFFRLQLRSHPQAQRAVEYLKNRGLSGAVAAEFGLGYAPPGWDNILTALGKDAAAIPPLIENGLVIEQPERRYDRFRDRIMFPIRDRRGRTIGFGGRVLGDDKPKYLNSPESALFHKGKELYGLYEARKALRHIERLLIVEGYMDVIALAQFGIRYAVATLGTATTAEHLEKLFRVSNELVFCFDGDRAGREAAWKALQIALPAAREGREIRFLFLPEGEDPDTLIRGIGPDEFAERIRAAQHLSDFFFDRLSLDVDTCSLDGRARLAEQARPLLDKLPAGVFRDMMTVRLAKLVGLPPENLGLRRPNRQFKPAAARPRNPGHLTPVRRAIAILLQHPTVGTAGKAAAGDWQRLETPGIKLLRQLLDLTAQHPNLTTAAVVERWRGTEVFSHFQKLANCDLSGNEQGLEQELLGALERLNQQVREQEAETLLNRTRISDMTDEEKERLKTLLNRSKKEKTSDFEMEP